MKCMSNCLTVSFWSRNQGVIFKNVVQKSKPLSPFAQFIVSILQRQQKRLESLWDAARRRLWWPAFQPAFKLPIWKMDEQLCLQIRSDNAKHADTLNLVLLSCQKGNIRYKNSAHFQQVLQTKYQNMLSFSLKVKYESCLISDKTGWLQLGNKCGHS